MDPEAALPVPDTPKGTTETRCSLFRQQASAWCRLHGDFGELRPLPSGGTLKKRGAATWYRFDERSTRVCQRVVERCSAAQRTRRTMATVRSEGTRKTTEQPSDKCRIASVLRSARLAMCLRRHGPAGWHGVSSDEMTVVQPTSRRHTEASIILC